MAQWAVTEDDDWQQDSRESISPTPDKGTKKEVLLQPLLNCRQGKISPENNNCGTQPATGLGRNGSDNNGDQDNDGVSGRGGVEIDREQSPDGI
jgi:hypothetical protein